MNKEFQGRLKVLLEHYELGVSAFADKIGVQRSSMSHILSGRNKPSLDFVMKVVQTFPEVNLYWLLNGKGSFPNETAKETITLPHPQSKANSMDASSEESKEVTRPSSTKQVSKIVFFYTDGTFETFKEKKQ